MMEIVDRLKTCHYVEYGMCIYETSAEIHEYYYMSLRVKRSNLMFRKFFGCLAHSEWPLC